MLEIKVGTYIQPDEWAVGEVLRQGLKDFCQFYLPVLSGGPIKEVAVNVEVSGRKPRRRQGGWCLRVKITFVGDGEPNTSCGGWVPCNYYGESP